MSNHQYIDDAPVGVPAGVNVHDLITVTTAITTLATATGSGGIPSYQAEDHEPRWPRAVYLGTASAAHDVWVTVDGQAPVVGTTSPMGIKVPPTYPSLRLPFPAVIKADGIKLLSDQAGGAPVIVCWEF